MSATSGFVGRAREWQALRAMLDAARAGTGGIALLAGEPGIGKTRTAEELAAYARQQGAQVLWGRCYEGEGAPAFWPWVQAIRTYVRTCDPTALSAAMGPGAADIAQLVPEARALLPELPTPPPLEPAQARFRLFESVAGFLRSASTTQPLALILDDLHWADAPSLLLLQFLARELAESRLLVVGTYRDIEVHPGHPLTQTLVALAREPVTARLLLRGLGEEELARVIENLAGCPLPAPLVAALYHTTEGNPFFATEVVRLMVAEGRLPRLEDGAVWRIVIPPSVRDVVGQRLSRLSAACNRVLTVAAVIGREFSLNALGQVSELAGERLLDVLEEAETARVIAAVSGAPGRFRFMHALIREVVYEALPTSRRVRLHRQVGEALEGLWGAYADEHLAELAHHFLQAAPGGDAAKAVEYARRAGDRAHALFAYEEAARHYALALQALELQASVDAAVQYQVLLDLGTVQNAAGDMPAARDTYARAAEVARRLQAPEQLARAALGFTGSWMQFRGDTAAVRLLEEALRALDEGDSALRAMLLAHLARLAVFPDGATAPADRRRVLAREAIAMARRVGDADALMYALRDAYWVLQGPDEIEERLAITNEILRLAEETGARSWAWHGHSLRLLDLLQLGDTGAVDLELRAHARLAEELRWIGAQHEAGVRQAMRALLAGDFAAGERLARRALAIAERTLVPAWLDSFTVLMFIVRREQGRLAELEAEVDALVERSPERPAWWCMRTLLYSELGRAAEARAEFERLTLAAPEFGGARQDLNRVAALALLAEVCARLPGRDRDAARLYRLLLPYAGHNIAMEAFCFGAAGRYLGLLAATMGRWQTAARHFDDALALNGRMGARPWVAHTQYDYVAMLLSRMKDESERMKGPTAAQDVSKAVHLLDQALATAQALGMCRLAEQALALKDRIAQMLPSAARTLPGGLTAREAEVLRLLAAGRSNREIADALVVSVRTAEHHIASIYAKTGAHRRADATLYALRHGLLPPDEVAR